MVLESSPKVTLETLRRMKSAGDRITAVTAYDWMVASLLDAAGVDMLVVGDSLGMSVQGHPSTLPVTRQDILYHTRAVARGTRRAMVVADMPFLTYEITVEEAVRTAGEFVQVGGADAVKIEGGEDMVPVVRALLRAKIPVMGHLGITPQSYLTQSGLKHLPGKTAAGMRQLLDDGIALDRAGVFAILLEGLPGPLAKLMRGRLNAVLIGLGSGPEVDGQGLVHTDLLGLPTTLGRKPRFAKQYADLSDIVTRAIRTFVAETKSSAFPGSEHVYPVTPAQVDAITALESECSDSTDKGAIPHDPSPSP